MKKIIILMIAILAILAGLSSTYAIPLPTRVYTELSRGTMGRYVPYSSKIEIDKYLPSDEIEYVYTHELGHFISFEIMSKFQRTTWAKATDRNPYEPTPYSAMKGRHYHMENLAECYAEAVINKQLPPENTTQRRIITYMLEVTEKLGS